MYRILGLRKVMVILQSKVSGIQQNMMLSISMQCSASDKRPRTGLSINCSVRQPQESPSTSLTAFWMPLITPDPAYILMYPSASGSDLYFHFLIY